MTATAEKIEFGQSFTPFTDTDTFSPVPNWLLSRPEVSFGAKCLYGRLRQYAGRDGLICPKLDTLARELGTSERSITRILNELREHCLVRSIRRGQGQSNLYELLTHIWMYQRGEPVTEPEESASPDRTDPSTPDWTDPSTHTFKRKQQKKTAAKTEAAVVSLPDDSQTENMLALIPADVPVTEGIQRIIKTHLAKSGTAFVSRNIAYTNANIRNKDRYRAYLDKCLRGDWGIDWAENRQRTEQAARLAEERACEADRQAGRELIQGLEQDRRRAELAQSFLSMPETGREEIRQAYLSGCNAFILRKIRHLDHTGLAGSLGFRLFLEGRDRQ